MYLTDALQILARRWALLVLAGALTSAAAVFALLSSSTQYQATGQVLLLPPASQIFEQQRTNPYLAADEGLVLTASLISNSLKTAAHHEELRAAGFDSDYRIVVVPDTGPLIFVAVEDTRPDRAIAMRDELLVDVEQGLGAIQADEGVAERQLVRSRRFVADTEAQAQAGARIRAAGTVGALGFVVSLLTIFALDRVLTGRSPRPARDDAPAVAV